METDTTQRTTTPRGWPPEVHLATVSRGLLYTYLALQIVGAVLAAWAVAELRGLREDVRNVQTHQTTEQHR